MEVLEFQMPKQVSEITIYKIIVYVYKIIVYGKHFLFMNLIKLDDKKNYLKKKIVIFMF
jgi:hypothetical protein